MSRALLLGTMVAVAAVCGAQAQTVRDLSPEQTSAHDAAPTKPGSLTILTLLDRPDATYALGETVRLAVKSSEDAYITVFNVGPSGKVTQLFPNAFQTANKVKAGEAVEIPAAASGAQIRVTGPVGAELIKVIATSKPVTVIPDTHFASGAGLFRSLDGGVEVFNRDLEVVSSNPPADTKVAVVNQVVKTVAARPAGAATTGVAVAGVAVLVPVTASTAAAPIEAGVAAQTFPLLLAADKASYRVGERLTVAVTPLQPCTLAVWSTNSAGQARLLFPSAAAPANRIAALQTVMIAGGPAPQTLVAGAPGSETLTALCTSEARALPFAPRSASDVLSGAEKAALERDLAVVPSQPAGTAGFAQLTIGVTP